MCCVVLWCDVMLARFWVFFCVFMSFQPVYTIVTHQTRHFSLSFASFLHICFADISNLGRFIRSPPRCGVAMLQVHEDLVVVCSGAMWCCVEWSGVDGVVPCGVPKALLPNGNGREVLLRTTPHGITP